MKNALLLFVQLTFCAFSQAQPADEVFKLGEFLKELKSIKPISGELQYDSFPGFDFIAFKPRVEYTTFDSIRFLVGSSGDEVKAIIFLKANRRIGVMNVHRLPGERKILTYQTDSLRARYPSIPLFGISGGARFLVHLNKGFEYGRDYTPANVSLVEIMRDDLFPVYNLHISGNYIRVIEEIHYLNGRSKIAQDTRVSIVYDPEKQKLLKITKESKFPEDYELPRVDFGVVSQSINPSGIPGWVYR